MIMYRDKLRVRGTGLADQSAHRSACKPPATEKGKGLRLALTDNLQVFLATNLLANLLFTAMTMMKATISTPGSTPGQQASGKK